MYDEIFKLIQNGELNKAQEQLENTPENDPKRYNISGLIYFQKKEFDKAKEEFEKGLKINPVDSDLLFNYGYLLKDTNQEKEAWRYLMRIHNKDWATYDLLGDIEYKNRSKLASLRFYKKAAELPDAPQEMKKKFIEMRNNVKQDTKIAFLCLPGLDNFLKDIVETFSLGYDVKLVVTTDGNQISEAIKWADIVWLEWANEMAIFATNQVPEIQNKKVVCRLHSYEIFTQFPEKINWTNIDQLIFVGDHIKRILHELHSNLNIDPDKEIIVSNGVDLDKFKFLIHKPGYNLSVLAHINYKKDPSAWIQIISKLKEIDNRYKLHVGGDFQDPRYKIYFDYVKKEMNLENNFILHGWIKEVDKFLEDKDYTLSTSIHESFGYNIAEAMARGIKPIIHNFDGAKSIWPNELIYNTIDEAVEKITEESYDSESYRRFIEDNYSLEEQINRIGENIKSLNMFNKSYYSTISQMGFKENDVFEVVSSLEKSFDSELFKKEVKQYINKIETLKNSHKENIEEMIDKRNSSKTSVSVITPSYNCVEFLPNLLNSLKNQTIAKEVEWIIIDDCSNDNSIEFYNILEKETTIGRIRVFRNSSNSGAGLSLKRGFNLASTDVLAWVSADDFYVSRDKLEKDSQKLKEQNIDIVYSKYTIYGSDLSSSKKAIVPEVLFSSNKYYNFLRIAISNPLNGSSMVMKKNSYIESGGFNEFLVNVDGDFDLLIRFILLNKKIDLSDTTVFQTIHKNQTSKNMLKMAIGTNITRISFIRLLEKTGEIDKLIDELSKINNINDIVKFTTLNYRFVWLLELLHKDKVKFKKYIQQFNRLPKELKDFQDTIYNLSDEFMKSQVFKLFENNYKNSI